MKPRRSSKPTGCLCQLSLKDLGKQFNDFGRSRKQSDPGGSSGEIKGLNTMSSSYAECKGVSGQVLPLSLCSLSLAIPDRSSKPTFFIKLGPMFSSRAPFGSSPPRVGSSFTSFLQVFLAWSLYTVHRWQGTWRRLKNQKRNSLAQQNTPLCGWFFMSHRYVVPQAQSGSCRQQLLNYEKNKPAD